MKTIIPYILIVFAILVGGGSIVLIIHFPSIGPVFQSLSSAERLLFDAGLCLLFFIQHSGMIRRGFKRRIGAIVPARFYPAAYAIVSGVALGLLVLFWQRTDNLLFELQGPARWLSTGLSVLAAMGFFWGARSLGKGGFDPLGLVAIRKHWRGNDSSPQGLAIRGPYRFVRHPLYLFVLLALWAVPRVTTDVLLFNALFTAWIIVATRWEERDLVAQFGEAYRRYQAEVPMLFPLSPRRS